MAVNINQEIRDRKNALKDLSVSLRAVDSAVERVQRTLNRIIRRKRSLPSLDDLLLILDGTTGGGFGDKYSPGIQQALTKFVKDLQTAKKIFETI